MNKRQSVKPGAHTLLVKQMKKHMLAEFRSFKRKLRHVLLCSFCHKKRQQLNFGDKVDCLF